jgi:hypothetical protein
MTPERKSQLRREGIDPFWQAVREYGGPDKPRKICSVCGRLVATDPRGDVLDSSGRCDECRP